MKVQIICGFLGAGKTTMLKNLLKKETSDTAVLVNEFGELGIDGALISEGNNFNVHEMPSGCICCTLRESLVDAVKEIMDKYHPKRLIIEPSGIASPSSIILGLKGADFLEQIELAPVVGIIDLTFFIEMVNAGGVGEIGEFFKDQIVNSDIILLNKADLVTVEEIEKCREAIVLINPACLIIQTVFCETELPVVEAKGEVTHFHYSPHFHAESFIISGEVDFDKFQSLMTEVKNKKYGEVLRAKGIFNTPEEPKTFDYVHGLIDFGHIDAAVGNKFVFIGHHIDRAKLETAVRECIKHGAGS